MGLHKIDKNNLIEPRVKTTPENVQEANEALFHAKMTLPAAAKHCGMTHKEMKLTFWEFLKYNKPDYEISQDSPQISGG
jgi:hypothetical protein|tara:strand:+ start:744 stop:980 length:237 start_codon:yes stop_codon:yes gene_type:complete